MLLFFMKLFLGAVEVEDADILFEVQDELCKKIRSGSWARKGLGKERS
jgi:hypothetical protein